MRPTPHLVVLLLVLVSLTAAAAPPPTFRESEWQAVQGRWRFEPDGQLTCAGETRSSLIYRRDTVARDLDLSVDVMFLGPESSAGLVFRSVGRSFYRDTTFYQFEWYTAGHHHGRRLSLMVKNPRWKQIVSPVLRDAPFNRWIRFRVRVEDERIQCFIDNERVFQRRDRTYRRAGRLGLHVFQPHRVQFRAPRLEILNPGPASTRTR